MDREEAQNILQLCRLNNLEDRNDTLIAEALEFLAQDAELSTWFDEQQALDAEISTEFNKIQPPANLKDSILKGIHGRLAQSELLMGDAVDDVDDDDALPFSATHRPWLQPWMGIAAIFAVAGVILVILPSEEPTQIADAQVVETQIAETQAIDTPATEAQVVDTQVAINDVTASPIITTTHETVIVATIVPDVIHYLATQISDFTASKYDKQDEQISILKSHLASTGMPSPAHVPSMLSELPTMGCVTFDFEGTKLSMICFKNGQVYHLITADKATFPKDCAPNCSKEAPEFFNHLEQAFKVWSEGEQVYILTTKGTEADIPDFI